MFGPYPFTISATASRSCLFRLFHRLAAGYTAGVPALCCLSRAQDQAAGEPVGCDQVRNCQALTKDQHSNRLARRRCGRPLVSSCLCPTPCVLCKASVMTVPCSRHLPVLLPSRVVAAVNHHARGTVVMYLPRRGCSLPRGRFFRNRGGGVFFLECIADQTGGGVYFFKEKTRHISDGSTVFISRLVRRALGVALLGGNLATV